MDKAVAVFNKKKVNRINGGVIDRSTAWLTCLAESLLKDALFRHAALLGFASLLATAGNIVFQMVVGRVLPAGEYALLATFLAAFAVLMRPAGTLASAMTHYTALLWKDGRKSCIRRLVIKWTAISGCFTIPLVILSVIFSRQIAEFFYLERIAPVILSATALPAIFIAPVFLGTLRGLQFFSWVAANQVCMAFFRVLFTLIFLFAFYASCGWALLGHVASLYLALVLAVVSLCALLRFKKDGKGACSGFKLPSMRSYLVWCMVVQCCFAVLASGDMIMVKHFLPETSGFAYAATLSRLVSLIAAAIGGSMIPKVVSNQVFTREHRNLYYRSMVYTSVTVLVSLGFCLFIPSLILRLLFGPAAHGADVVAYTRGMALAMTPSTLLGINVGLLLSQRRFSLLGVIVLCAVAYIVAVGIWHEDAMQIIWVSGLTNLAGLVATTFGILMSREGRNEKLAK